MSYIYVITNNINGKQYVGKTDLTVEDRFKQHCKDSRKKNVGNRPLYRAFKKYGIDHFSYRVLEECSYLDSSIRETYWIGRLNTYQNGYNATLGGDGTRWQDYKTIAEQYKKFQNAAKTARYCKCDVATVCKACRVYNIPIKTSQDVSKAENGHSVAMLDKNTSEVLKQFDSLQDAGRYIIRQKISNASLRSISINIGRVAKGERPSAYGFKWKELIYDSD